MQRARTQGWMVVVAAWLALAVGGAIAAPKEKVRPAVGKPLQTAQRLIESGKYKEALRPIAEAEKVGDASDYERFVILRMKGAALAGAGDADGAANAFEKVLAAKRLSRGEELRVMESVAGTYFRARNHGQTVRWVRRYEQHGGTRDEILDLLPQAHYLSGDHAQAARTASARVAAIERTGGRPGEDLLKLQAASLQKSGDAAGYARALESLVRFHPSPAYWSDVITRTARRPGLPRNLELDTYRLRLATGTLTQARDYMEAAQLAVQADLIGEAQRYIELAYEKGIFGTGEKAQVERQARLKALVEKKRADDRKQIAAVEAAGPRAQVEARFKAGRAYVAYGEIGKGLPMMEQAMRDGGLKSPDASRLDLAYAYHLAGRTDRSRATLREVQATGPAADLARLWLIALEPGRGPR